MVTKCDPRWYNDSWYCSDLRGCSLSNFCPAKSCLPPPNIPYLTLRQGLEFQQVLGAFFETLHRCFPPLHRHPFPKFSPSTAPEGTRNISGASESMSSITVCWKWASQKKRVDVKVRLKYLDLPVWVLNGWYWVRKNTIPWGEKQHPLKDAGRHYEIVLMGLCTPCVCTCVLVCAEPVIIIDHLDSPDLE